MGTRAVTINIPDELYDRLLQRAARADRTVEQEVQDVMSSALLAGADLPPDLAASITPLAFLSDEDLWRAARSRLSRRSASRLAALNDKRQREGLTEEEERSADALVREYERVMLVRAHAAVLLKQRGYDISELGPRQ